MIHRQFLGFDTSKIKDFFVIHNVKLRIYVTHNTWGVNDYIYIIKTTYNRANADYQAHHNQETTCGVLTYNTVNDGGLNRYYDIPLTDLSIVIKNGTTKIGLRDTNDNGDIDPASGGNKNPPFTFQRQVDANPPQLVINYSADNHPIFVD